MGRGRLRVLLGAAPGVGKTYTMLEEGHRLVGEGRDVVVAIVETHGRSATAALTAGLETVPRRRVAHRGVDLEEMDLDAVLARRPAIALVDELAHSNAPGSTHEKRWQDVAALLEAGVDVISTVNIQHIESLGDVVQQITGVPQRETIPDRVPRSADQIEVIDLDPQALRDRLTSGRIYPAERVDAALANYFRLGNLTALRELALLWLADEVDTALTSYREAHGIDSTWEARERVVVTLTGGPEGETLLRRGARIAARSSGGELLAVHVTTQDGLRQGDPEDLARQRALVEKLGGSYHQVVGDDVPRALVDFAKGRNATQLVIGVSRRTRLQAALTGPGIGATVIRESGDIDVHIVNHASAGGRARLPRLGGALSLRRRIAGFALALVGGPLLTWMLVALRSDDSITSDVLAFQLLVVIVALVGGVWPALFAAVLSGVTLDFFFVQPFYTVTIDKPLHLLAILLYVVIAILVSVIVDRAARQTRAALRAASESELLTTVSGSVLRGSDAVAALVARTREAFGLRRVRLVDGEAVLAESAQTEAAADDRSAKPAGADSDRAPLTRVAVGTRATLELEGADLAADEQRLLAAIAAQLDAALEHRDLAEVASEVAPLAANDKVRSALLSALSHDLRRPLAAATAAIGGLRTAGEALSDDDRRELLATADESLGALAQLVTDLLDVSRLQAGVLAVATQPVDPADVILPALEELRVDLAAAPDARGPSGEGAGAGPGTATSPGRTALDRVALDLAPDLPAAAADPVLLQRVIVNLAANALRHSPAGTPITITTSSFADRVEVRVIDRGPGIPPERRDDVFVPFQRLGDTDNSTGLGLGLALSRGFVEGMRGTLTPEDTPGGGLTMVVALPVAADEEDAR